MDILGEIIYNQLSGFGGLHKVGDGVPDDERYGLIDQIKRSAVSIAANIAEGSGRNTTREFIQFLYISLGSACELETHLIISKEIGYLSDIENLIERINDIRRMINGLINSLKKAVNDEKTTP